MLNENQYSTSQKYDARIYLHRKFTTSTKSKYKWIFNHFPKKENLKILELGCGTGLFWLVNRNEIIKSWEIILSDYSAGMLKTTRNSLSRLNYNFQYEIVNVENIQFSDNTFDVILANNMLYHAQNRDEAIKNIYRILKNDGAFIASTMGKNDLMELHNYLYQFLENKGHNFKFREFVFSLDNGMEQLSKYFKNVIIERHENILKINEVEAIINYYLSFNEIHNNVIVLPEEYINEFRKYLQEIMEMKNEIIATKDNGIFVCKK